jgi:hypothetical protein
MPPVGRSPLRVRSERSSVRFDRERRHVCTPTRDPKDAFAHSGLVGPPGHRGLLSHWRPARSRPARSRLRGPRRPMPKLLAPRPVAPRPRALRPLALRPLAPRPRASNPSGPSRQGRVRSSSAGGSGYGESNPARRFGRPMHYHYAIAANMLLHASLAPRRPSAPDRDEGTEAATGNRTPLAGMGSRCITTML